MTSISMDQFTEFYSQVHREIGNGERIPHPWQQEVVSRIGVNHDAYVDIPAIVAPTGAGKSFIATLHLFVCAVYPYAPPRMVMVLPRRGLVDQVNEEISRIAEVIEVSSHPLVSSVREALFARRSVHDARNKSQVVVTDTLRGGVHGRRGSSWADDPSVCTVLSATPHMAISTLLSRSFGFAPKRHSAYAGLFAVGTVMVFDEAHIQRQAVKTARSVAFLVAQDSQRGGVTSQKLTVVEMTATPSDDMDTSLSVTVGDADVADPFSPIARVLTAPKVVSVTRCSDAGKDIPETLAESALEMRRSVGEGTLAVISNTVGSALKVTKILRKEGLRVVPITGRVRGADRESLFAAFPGVLTSGGSPDVDVVVATQTIEVGIDADFHGMVTELASGDSLAQRFGRVNRHGKRSTPAPIVVVQPPDINKSNGVYSASDLTGALQWIESLDEGKASPLAVKDVPPPVRKPERAVIETFHRGDALRVLLNSGQPPAVYDSPEFWFSDSLSNLPETRIVLRRGIKDMELSTRAALLDALRPQDEECWNVSSGDAESILKSLWNKREDNSIYAIDVRNDGGNLTTFDGKDEDGKPVYSSVAWSTVVVWAGGGVKMLDGGITVDGDSVGGVPAKNGTGIARPVSVETMLHTEGNGVRTKVYLGGEVPIPSDSDKASAAEKWGSHEDAPYWVAARRAAGGGEDIGGYVILGSRGDDGTPQWAVVVPYTTDDTDNPGSGDTSSSVSTSSAPVMLHNHRNDVAEACSNTATRCGVADSTVEAIRLAGLYHDDGKAHPGFQKLLKSGFVRGTAPDGDVAKSPQNSPFNAQSKTTFNLPRGWRHEQLSAAIAAKGLRGSEHRELVAVLAGLSHGYGRLTFPHGWSSLIGDSDIDAEDIFTDGTWEQWVSDLTHTLGPWHLAWLEALVRAADHSVSAQGH